MEELMEVLLVVSSAAAEPVLVPLARALSRAGAAWGCFLTGDGARALDSAAVRAALAGAVRAVACAHSWQGHAGATPCPVEAGSQLDHAAMLGAARRVLGL